MTQIITIPLTFGNGRNVEALLDSVAGSELAVILPGLRYGCDRPLLAGVANIFQERGCDIARLMFGYSEDTDFLAANDEAQLAQIASDGCDIADSLIDCDRYQSVWLIGKSLGTVAMGAALCERNFPVDCIRAIWLTPSLIGTPLPKQILAQNHPSIVVIGSDDQSFRPELIGPLALAPNIAVSTIQGADHGFEHSGGVVMSKSVIAQAIQVVSRWAKEQVNEPNHW